ncbi:MAG: CBS domain-containing protein [Gemmatimonadales bacterium]|nr:MAG: CBS domain-containing protein [Gemmatimonadales bacterium]
MSVGAICTRAVHTATRAERAREAARRMHQYKVGSLVVVDLEGKPVGILTDRDIAVKCVAEGMGGEVRVEEIMTRPVSTVHEDTSIDEAVKHMSGAQIRRLVVVDDDRSLVGLLALDDVLELLVEEAEDIGRLLHAQMPA